MDRINKILSNKSYKEYLSKICEHEENRRLCRHNLMHFMDVSRIMYILALEEKIKEEDILGKEKLKDVIYACGLLHDIGRWQQYDEGIPHEVASANLALDILVECGYNEEEITEIIKAIKGHRKDVHEEKTLCKIMYKADKLSRECFRCEVQEECNWSKEKKNLVVKY